MFSEDIMKQLIQAIDRLTAAIKENSVAVKESGSDDDDDEDEGEE